MQIRQNRGPRMATSAFYTQVHHSQFNPQGKTHTEDCGPTCLAMAISSLGLTDRLFGLMPGRERSTQKLIDCARFAMFSSHGVPSDPVKCSFARSASGDWVLQEAARHTLTNLDDLVRGVDNCSVRSFQVEADILTDKRMTLPLILAGDPSLEGAYGDRLGIDYKGGHFIFLPPQAAQSTWLIHDPLCLTGPAHISRSELFGFLSADIFTPWVGLRIN